MSAAVLAFKDSAKKFVEKLVQGAEKDLKAFVKSLPPKAQAWEKTTSHTESLPQRGGYGPYEVGVVFFAAGLKGTERPVEVNYTVRVVADLTNPNIGIGALSNNHVLEGLASRGTMKDAPARLKKVLSFFKEGLEEGSRRQGSLRMVSRGSANRALPSYVSSELLTEHPGVPPAMLEDCYRKKRARTPKPRVPDAYAECFDEIGAYMRGGNRARGGGATHGPRPGQAVEMRGELATYYGVVVGHEDGYAMVQWSNGPTTGVAPSNLRVIPAEYAGLGPAEWAVVHKHVAR